MSYHQLTFKQLKDEVEHAIGGVPDSRTDSARIVNGAVEYLTTKHQWGWRTKITTLDFNTGVGEIDLPDDFGEMIDIVGKGLRNTAVRKADPQTVNRVRVYGLTNSNLSLVYFIGMGEQTTGSTGGGVPFTFSSTITAADPAAGKIRFDTATVGSIANIYVSETDANAVDRHAFINSIDGSADLLVINLTNPGAYRVFRLDSQTDNGTWRTLAVTYKSSSGAFTDTDSISLVFVKNTGQSAQPKRQMVVAPIPAADSAQALYLTYRKLIPTMTADTDVPAIPLGFTELLRVLCRAMGYSSQVQQAGHDWQLFNQMLPDYIGADTMAGGALQGQLSDQLNGDGFMGDGIFRIAPHQQILMPGES